jgi:uncharacterized protein (TIGR03067 family)
VAVIARRFGILLAILCLASPVRAEERVKDVPQPLQGDWAIQSMEQDGHKTPAEKIKSVRIVIAGDHLTVHGDKGMESTIKLDSSKKPHHIDILLSGGPDKGKVWHGIYELQGDDWKLCLGKPGKERPTEFVSKENSGIVLMLLKREKP